MPSSCGSEPGGDARTSGAEEAPSLHTRAPSHVDASPAAGGSFGAASGAETRGLRHVVVCSIHPPMAVADAASVFAHSQRPASIVFHVITLPDVLRNMSLFFAEWKQRLTQPGSLCSAHLPCPTVDIVQVDTSMIPEQARSVLGTSVLTSVYSNALNMARFFLQDMLPGVDKYLHPDQVIWVFVCCMRT